MEILTAASPLGLLDHWTSIKAAEINFSTLMKLKRQQATARSPVRHCTSGAPRDYSQQQSYIRYIYELRALNHQSLATSLAVETKTRYVFKADFTRRGILIQIVSLQHSGAYLLAYWHSNGNGRHLKTKNYPQLPSPSTIRL